MSDDFLTRERIERLQVMGITVWQERGKRASLSQKRVSLRSSETASPAVQPIPQSAQIPSKPVPASASMAAKPPVTQVVQDAPKPDASNLDWQQLRATVAHCRACVLCETRTQTVFGVGDQTAQVMVIGEAPGAEEDRRGEPFVGNAGKLLDAMLLSVGLKRANVFIANVLKCRPPGNRDPHASEASQCSSYLERQIELINPRVLIAVGRVASQLLLKSNSSLGRLRSKTHTYGDKEIPCVVTYHPAYLLRSPKQKRKAWEDLLMSQDYLESNS